MLFDQITIIGVGLIGGSIGLAAKVRGVAGRVVGVGRDPKKLADAMRLGAIGSFTTDLTEAARTSDLIIVCTPVDRIADTILGAAPHCRPGTIFTDGGSTKAQVVAAVAGKLPAGIAFVPAHPLAGSEKNGVAYARADLYQNRLTILTPTEHDEPTAVERVEAFWKALGSRVVRMPPAEHDVALAATSHLPHAVAAALAAVTPPDWLPLSAGGFRDTTRIAGGDPHLWAAIFQANRGALLAALATFAQRTEALRQLLEHDDHDGIVNWLSEGKRVRDALGT